MKSLQVIAEELLERVRECGKGFGAETDNLSQEQREWLSGGVMVCALEYVMRRLHNQRGFFFDQDDVFHELVGKLISQSDVVSEPMVNGFSSVQKAIEKVYSQESYEKISKKYFAGVVGCFVYPEQELNCLLPLYALKKVYQSRFGSQPDLNLELKFDGSGEHSPLAKRIVARFADCYDSFAVNIDEPEFRKLLEPDPERMEMLGLAPNGELPDAYNEAVSGEATLVVPGLRVWEFGGAKFWTEEDNDRMEKEQEEESERDGKVAELALRIAKEEGLDFVEAYKIAKVRSS